MAASALLFALLLAALALIAWRGWRRGEGYERQRGEMPRELRQARLIASELPLRCFGARPMHGKTDQAFDTGAHVVPVETKTRRLPVAFDGDVVQLSVQARLLRDDPRRVTRGRPVASYGYVRIARPRQADRYVRVQLLDDAQLDAHYDRTLLVRREGCTPRPAAARGLCERCAFRPECPHRSVAAGLFPHRARRTTSRARGVFAKTADATFEISDTSARRT